MAIGPLRRLLTQGISPRALSLSLAIGLGLGTFPVLGSTTLLCAGAAVWLRLNQPAIQLANYLAYPLQLMLLVPLLRGGAALLGTPAAALSLDALRAQIAVDPWGMLRLYGLATAGAVLLWAAVAVPSMFILARAVRPLLERLPFPGRLKGDAA